MKFILVSLITVLFTSMSAMAVNKEPANYKECAECMLECGHTSKELWPAGDTPAPGSLLNNCMAHCNDKCGTR